MCEQLRGTWVVIDAFYIFSVKVNKDEVGHE